MTIITWIMEWRDEIELLALGLQVMFFLLLVIGVFCMVHQQKRANRTRRRLELYFRKRMDKQKEEVSAAVSPSVHKEKEHVDEEESRIISAVLQEIFP